MGWDHVSILWEDKDTTADTPLSTTKAERVGNIVEDEKMVSFDVGQKLSYADVVQNKSDKISRDEKRDEETIGRPQGLQFVSNPI